MKIKYMTLLSTLCFGALSSSGLQAKDSRNEMAVCRDYIRTLCAAERKNGHESVTNCLVANFDKLTPECQKPILFFKDCGSDIKEKCQAEKDRNRARKCLRKNKNELSDACAKHF